MSLNTKVEIVEFCPKIMFPFFLLLKFIYSEKATKFFKIFPLLLTAVHTVKSKGKILQNFVAFSDYMNFNEFANDCHDLMNWVIFHGFIRQTVALIFFWTIRYKNGHCQ